MGERKALPCRAYYDPRADEKREKAQHNTDHETANQQR
jgi:hypothetical protein